MSLESPTRRELIASGLAVAAGAAFPDKARAEQRIIMNDASRLNPTPLYKHLIWKDDPSEIFIAALRTELKRAASAKRPIAVSAARHSMGAKACHATALQSPWRAALYLSTRPGGFIASMRARVGLM
jgi:hypothetical protein